MVIDIRTQLSDTAATCQISAKTQITVFHCFNALNDVLFRRVKIMRSRDQIALFQHDP